MLASQPRFLFDIEPDSVQLIHHGSAIAHKFVTMPQEQTDIPLGLRWYPDSRKPIREEQIEDVQGITRVCFLPAYPRRAHLSRISYPKFVAIAKKNLLEPLRADCSFYAHTSRVRKRSIELRLLPTRAPSGATRSRRLLDPASQFAGSECENHSL